MGGYGSYHGEDKPNKGHEGGACNRQSCQAEPALYYNHGSYSWYCLDCMVDIGLDPFNKQEWDRNWKPGTGHDQFETREQMDARINVPLPEGAVRGPAAGDTTVGGPYPPAMRGHTSPMVTVDDFSFFPTDSTNERFRGIQMMTPENIEQFLDGIEAQRGNPSGGPVAIWDGHGKDSGIYPDWPLPNSEFDRTVLDGTMGIDVSSVPAASMASLYTLGNSVQQIYRAESRMSDLTSARFIFDKGDRNTHWSAGSVDKRFTKSTVDKRAKVKAARKAAHHNRKKRQKSRR